MTKNRRKILNLAAFITAGLILFGCGGGSSSSTDETPSTGTAYYVDSAVSGISYECGSESGTTGENGEFTFEVGQSCTFYLGNVFLRDIEESHLQNGGEIQETDTSIARILQTFDADGDPANGITISAEVVEALVSAGITSLPDTEEEYTSMVEAVGDVATVITEEAAEAHLLNSILAGTSLFDVGRDANGLVYNSVTFPEDMTTVNWTNQFETESGSGDISYADGFLTVTEEGEEPFTLQLSLVEVDDSYYIEMLSEDDHIERLYPHAEEAETYLIGVALTGRTVYLVDETNQFLESWAFNPELTEVTWSDGSESGTATVSYQNGVITATDGDGNAVFTATGITSSYIPVNYDIDDNGTGTGRIYFDEEAAEIYLATLIENDNGGGDDTLTFTAAMLSGQTWYTNDFVRLDFSSTNETFTATSLTNLEEDDGSESFPYEINTDGQLILGGEEILTLISQDENSYTADYSEVGSDDAETLIFYTSKSAFDATLYTDLSSTVTITDKPDDSFNTTHAGFELLTLSVVEDGSDLVVTATANGNILDALATASSAGYEHNMWIELNDSLEFGFADASTVWCDENTWENGEFTGGTSVPTSEYSYSINGDTIIFTIAADRVPQNGDSYLRVVAEIGEDEIVSVDEGDDQFIFDSIQLGAIWSYGDSDSGTGNETANNLTGTWVYDAEGYPFDVVLVVAEDGHYIGAQQRLGESGVIGGVEEGYYNLVDENTLNGADPIINSNAEDSLVGATVTLDDVDSTIAYIETPEDGTASISKIVSSDDHPEAGAWINDQGNITGDGETAILLVLDGAGNYMQVDLNENYSDFHFTNDIIQNATEFGTYIVNGDGTVDVAPAAETDTSAVCTNIDSSGCGAIAGDSNAAAGFSDLSNMQVGVDIINDALTLTVEGEQITFQRVQ